MKTQTLEQLSQRVRELEQALADQENAMGASKLNIAAITRLHKLGMLSTQHSKLAEVLMEILDAAIEITTADFGSIQLIDPFTGCLRIEAQRGFSKSWVEFWSQASEGDGACGAALEKGERVIVKDVEKSKIFVGTPGLEVQLKANVHALQSSPIESRSGQTLGIFSTYYKTPKEPDATKLQWLDLLARQAADLIEQSLAKIELEERSKELARLAGELTMAEHRERRRLADYLHNDLQQLLVGARLQAQAISRSIPKKTAAALEVLVQTLKEAIDGTRGLSRELAPPVSIKGNLAETCHWIAAEVKARHMLEVEVEVAGGFEDVPEPESILLYSAARELLLNIVKHSGVLAARLELAREESGVVMRIRDQGCGYDPMAVAASKAHGLGLFSIRERIVSMGGSLTVESAVNSGTCVVLEVPVASSVDTQNGESKSALEEGVAGSEEPDFLPDGAGRIRVIFVDDHRIVRESLVSLINGEPDIEVIGQCENGREALEHAGRLKPDVFVMDGNMPVMNGIEATRAIKDRWPSIKVIGLSMMGESEGWAKMCAAGADGYVSKSGPTEELVGAIRRCCGLKVPSKKRSNRAGSRHSKMN
jgi:signal transduction histidine kinase/ActR/RegA family two-component response regulator